MRQGDGVFDRLSNKQVVDAAWEGSRRSAIADVHRMCGESVEHVLRTSAASRTLDNVTVVMVALANFGRSASRVRQKYAHAQTKTFDNTVGSNFDLSHLDLEPGCLTIVSA